MSLEILIPIFFVAILTITGNVAFFKYQFKKDNNWKILHQQLTELLLPLFYAFKNDEFNQSEWFGNDNIDEHEIVAQEPKRLMKEIIPIVKNKLYLADNELHASCIKFLEWAHGVNESNRFDESHTNDIDINTDKALLEFKELVFKKYNATRNNYLKQKYLRGRISRKRN
ncbi:MAG: hypothetical protein V1768_01910 [Patescibacteria group bacterium]